MQPWILQTFPSDVLPVSSGPTARGTRWSPELVKEGPSRTHAAGSKVGVESRFRR